MNHNAVLISQFHNLIFDIYDDNLDNICCLFLVYCYKMKSRNAQVGILNLKYKVANPVELYYSQSLLTVFSKMRTVTTTPEEEWMLLIRYNPLTNTTTLYLKLITFKKHFKIEDQSTDSLHYLHLLLS